MLDRPDLVITQTHNSKNWEPVYIGVKNCHDHNMPGLLACWDFRANEDYFTCDQLLSLLPRVAKKFCFQLEKGDTRGYRHWQGRVSLHKKRRKDEIMPIWLTIFDKFPNFFEPTVEKEHHKGEMFYQQKIDTRLEGPWTDRMKPSYVRKRFRNATLKPWQDAILRTSSKDGNDDRCVNVLICRNGNIGKSFVCDYCSDHKLAIEIPSIVNDGKEILQAVCGILLSQENREPGLMYLDMPRAMNKDRLNGIMTALETIKRGKVYDFRYKYTEWLFESPAIWVFTNMTPDRTWLSADRWKFWKVIDNELTPFEEPEPIPFDEPDP